MKTLYLLRRKRLDDRTLGRLLVFDGLTMQASFATMEPPWAGNEANKSCIPSGIYVASPRSSQKFGDHLLIEDVPDRTYILCHRGNYPSNTQGCVLVGMAHKDLNWDGKADISSSQAAMDLLVQFVRAPARLVIIDEI